MVRRFCTLLGILVISLVVGLAAVEGRVDSLSPAEALKTVGLDTSALSQDKPLTRAQLAYWAVRAAGEQALLLPGRPVSFADVPGERELAPYIYAAARVGLMQGDAQGRFRPDDLATYLEAAVVFMRLAGQPEQPGDWPMGYILRAYDLGLLRGIPFIYNKPVSAGDFVTMLYRAVFEVAGQSSGQTLSQAVHRQPVRLELAPPGGAASGAKTVTAKGIDAAGRSLVVDAEWLVNGRRYGTGPEIKLEPGPDRQEVTARYGHLIQTAVFYPLDGLAIVRPAVLPKAGERVQLTAVGLSSGGDKVVVQPKWRVVTGPGTVTETGLFTAGGAGAVVEAMLGEFTATMAIAPVGSTGIGAVNQPHLLFREVGDTVANGTSQMLVQVELRDSLGNLKISDNTSLVYLSATSGQNSLGTKVATASDGVASFSLTATAAGSYTLKAWSANHLSAEGMARFIPGPPSRLTLAAEPVASLAADGASTTALVVRVMDVFNNTVTTASNPVTLARVGTGGAVFVVGDQVVVPDQGIARFTVRAGAQVGTDYFQATSPGLTASGTVGVTTRVTGPPYRLAVQPVAGVVAGTEVEVVVQVQDYLGQLVTGDHGRVISISLAGANYKATTNGGMARFKLTHLKAETVTLTASSTGLVPDSRTIVFTPAAGQRVVLAVSAKVMAADGESTVTISPRVVDAFGNQVSEFRAVTLYLSDPSLGSLGSTVVYTGGAVTLTAREKAGELTIFGASDTYPVVPVRVVLYTLGEPARVVVQPPAPVHAGVGVFNVEVWVTDHQERVIPGLNTGSGITAVGLSLSGGTGATTVSVGDATGLADHGFTPDGVTRGAGAVVNGKASFTITNSRAETLTLTPLVYYMGQPLQPVTALAVTQPGAGVWLAAEPVRVLVAADRQEEREFTVRLVDTAGNPVGTNLTATVTLTRTDLLELMDGPTLSLVNGVGKVRLRSKGTGAGGTTQVVWTAQGGSIAGTALAVSEALPARPVVTATDSLGQDHIVGPGEAGARLVLTLEARDSEQRITVFVNGRPVVLYQSPGGGVIVDGVGPGATAVTGYVLRSDLGPAGVKEIRVMAASPLGTGPLSNPVYIEVK